MPTLTPISGNLGINRARHLLKRLTYGADKQTIQQFANLDATSALNLLFNNVSIPPHPVALPDAWDLNPPAGGNWVDQIQQDDEKDFALTGYFKKWWLGLMAKDTTALEKLTFFLHTVITDKNEVGGGARAMYWQNYLFRLYIINDFSDSNPKFNRYKQLVKKVCVDNSMLNFLDGKLNVKSRPNENFGRELLELFTIGKGNSGSTEGDYGTYTEADIKAAAKVLTGWDSIDWSKDLANIDPDTGVITGKIKGTTSASEHDNTSKQFSYAFNNTVISPKTALLTADGKATQASAADEIDQFIEMIYAQEAASKYLIRKIYRFFVHWDLSGQSIGSAAAQQIEDQIITPLSQTFISGGFRLRPVLEQLFKSEFFYEADPGVLDDKFGSIVKSPLELTFGVLRYFKTPFAAINTAAIYTQMAAIDSAIFGMGLDFLNPYDVAGYEPYQQSPYFTRNWITTNSLALRYKFIEDLTKDNNTWGFDRLAWASGDVDFAAVATIPTTNTNDGKDYALTLIEYVSGEFLPLSTIDSEITQKRMNYFARYHLDVYTFADWKNYWDTKTGSGGTYTKEMLRLLLNSVLQSPEFQLF